MRSSVTWILRASEVPQEQVDDLEFFDLFEDFVLVVNTPKMKNPEKEEKAFPQFEKFILDHQKEALSWVAEKPDKKIVLKVSPNMSWNLKVEERPGGKMSLQVFHPVKK